MLEVSEDRINSLEIRQEHLDNRVSAISVDMASVKTSVDGIAESMRQVSEKVHAPKPVNWTGIIASVISVLTLVGMIGILALSPIQEKVAGLSNETNEEVDKLWLELREFEKESIEVHGDLYAKGASSEIDRKWLEKEIARLQDDKG